MSKPCYGGKNPIDPEDRYEIWKWAKENGIDKGMTFEQVKKAINDEYYGGVGRPEWIHDILSGRKTPFRKVAGDVWRKQYNRQAVVQQAKEASYRDALGPLGRLAVAMRFGPRSVAVFGHGVVFPVTHAGDLLLRPASWGTFTKGALRTYRSAFSSKYAIKALELMKDRELYDTALQSGLDVGEKSVPIGLISGKGKKTGYLGAASRAWDMLTVMRYELWEKQMGKYVKPGMTTAEVHEIGTQLAEWANHATGSASGGVARLGGGMLFGPKLTQSKISRVFIDPAKTAKTIANWRNATAGEKAVAKTRISGAIQYMVSQAGFLALNQGVLKALGQDDEINLKDAKGGDFWAFKGVGINGYIPGMHTELRTVAKLLSIAFQESTVMGKRGKMIQNPDAHGDSKFTQIATTLGQYGMGKLEPGIQRATELATGQNWVGRPLPGVLGRNEKGTEKKPALSAGEYAASVGPIPLEGILGYTYDQLRKNGASAIDATAILKGLIIFGGGLPGFHVKEDYSGKKD